MADFVKPVRTTEIEPDQARLQLFALDNTPALTAAGLSLMKRYLGHEVTCPWHGATFDVRTGGVVGRRPKEPLCDTAFA